MDFITGMFSSKQWQEQKLCLPVRCQHEQMCGRQQTKRDGKGEQRENKVSHQSHHWITNSVKQIPCESRDHCVFNVSNCFILTLFTEAVCTMDDRISRVGEEMQSQDLDSCTFTFFRSSASAYSTRIFQNKCLVALSSL